jgi:hypothetical protein
MEKLNIEHALLDFAIKLTELCNACCHDLLFYTIKAVINQQKSKMFILSVFKFLNMNISLINVKNSYECFKQMQIFGMSQMEKAKIQAFSNSEERVANSIENDNFNHLSSQNTKKIQSSIHNFSEVNDRCNDKDDDYNQDNDDDDYDYEEEEDKIEDEEFIIFSNTIQIVLKSIINSPKKLVEYEAKVNKIFVKNFFVF